jgi:hypothetical protein
LLFLFLSSLQRVKENWHFLRFPQHQLCNCSNYITAAERSPTETGNLYLGPKSMYLTFFLIWYFFFHIKLMNPSYG